MRFALLGDHPDGVDMASALAASGRHQVLLYSGPATALATLQRQGLQVQSVGDLEEVLADHDIDAVIVASAPSVRAKQLRRALQAECHVLCVHPADPSPDIAYEAALIQADTGRVLLPLLPLTFHPGIQRLKEYIHSDQRRTDLQSSIPPSTPWRLLELESVSNEEVLLEATLEGHKPGLPCWDILRLLGGEIREIALLSSVPEVQAGQVCLVSGRFLQGSLLQATYLPNMSMVSLRVSLVLPSGRVTLLFPQGWPGPAKWIHTDAQGETCTESWETLSPWPALVDYFEQAVLHQSFKKAQAGEAAEECLTKTTPRLGWQDELRGLELDDAVRRSAERGRFSALDLQETTEDAAFKGTMTLFGCSLIWLSLILLILATWQPWLLWLILPVFGIYLIMQLLGWVLPRRTSDKSDDGP